MELAREAGAAPAAAARAAQERAGAARGREPEPVPLDLLYPPEDQKETFTDAADLEKELPDIAKALSSEDNSALLETDDADADADAETPSAPSSAPSAPRVVEDRGEELAAEDLAQTADDDLASSDDEAPTPPPPLPPRSPIEEAELLAMTDQGQEFRLHATPREQPANESPSEALARVSDALRPRTAVDGPLVQTHVPLYPTVVPAPSAPMLDEFTPSAPCLEQPVTSSSTLIDLGNRNPGNRYLVEALGAEAILETLETAEASPYVNDHRRDIATLDLACPDGLEPVEDEFTQLVLKFRAAEENYEDFLNQLAQRIKVCRKDCDAMWTRKNGRAEQTQETRSGVGIVKASVPFVHYAYSRKKARAFEADLRRLGSLRSKDLTSFGFDRTMTAFNVQQKIYEELAQSPRFCPRLERTDAALRDPRAGAHARIYFTVLLSFELKARREIDEAARQALASQIKWRRRFLRCVRAWLAHLGAALLQSGRLEDRFFLLRHLIAFPGIAEPGNWALPLVQAGPELASFSSAVLRTSESYLQDVDWTEADVEVCLAMVQTLLHHADPLVDRVDGYEVIDEVELSDRRLSEADYLALLDQMPHSIAIDKVLPSSEHVAALTPEQVKAAFARVHAHVVALGTAVSQLRWFRLLGRGLKQAIVNAVVRAAAFLRDLECWDARAPWAVAQMHFDRLALLAMSKVLTSDNDDLRNHVQELPLDRLSCEASWRLFAGLVLGYTGPDFSSLDSIYTVSGRNGPLVKRRGTGSPPGPAPDDDGPDDSDGPGALFHSIQHVCDFSQWKSAVMANPALRQRFWRVLGVKDAEESAGPLARRQTTSADARQSPTEDSPSREISASRDPAHSKRLSNLQLDIEDDGAAMDPVSGTARHGEALFRVRALSALGAAAGEDLARAVVLEVAIAAFTSPGCALAHDELLRPVCELFAMVCRSHPSLTSELLRFVATHESSFTSESRRGLELIRALPLRGWKPRLPDDMDLLGVWLTPRTSSDGSPAPVLDARAEMAMAVLSELDFSVDANDELALDAAVHQSIAIIIAQACMARAALPHLERVSHAGALATLRRWIPLTADYTNSQEMVRFERWSWTTLLSLSLYNATTGEPLRPLLDVGNAADTGPGGALHHLWKSANQRARSMAEEALRPTLSTSASQAVSDLAKKEALHKFIHPVLSYVVLQVSNHAHKEDGWVPLRSLLHFSHPGVSTSWQLVERAYLSALQTLIPRYAFEVFDERADLTFRPLPDPGLWLLPFVESAEERDRAIETSGSFVAVGSGLVGDLISRVLTPDSPQGVARATPAAASPFGGVSAEAGSPSSLRSRSTSVASNGGAAAQEKLVTRSGQGAADRLKSLVESHVCAPLLCCDEAADSELRERVARCCVGFWMDQIFKIPQWQGLAACKTVLDGIVMASLCVQGKLSAVDLPREVDARLGGFATRLVALASASADEASPTALEPTALSILPAQSPGGFFAKTDVSEVIPHCDWLSFEALLVETGREYPLWRSAGAFLSRATNCGSELDNVRGSLEAELKAQGGLGPARNSMHVDFKKLSQFRIYRWANYALKVHADHPLLPLYWQLTLVLAFSRGANGRIFGMRFLTRESKQTRRTNVRESLLLRARELQLHYRDLARREAPLAPSPTRHGAANFRHRSSRRRFSSARRRSSSMSSGDPEGAAFDADYNAHLRSSAELEALATFYGAVSLWLRDPDPASWLGAPGSEKAHIAQLGPDFSAWRLDALLSTPLLEMLHEAVRTAIPLASAPPDSGPAEALPGAGASSLRETLWTDLVELGPQRDKLEFSCTSWSPGQAARRAAAGSASRTYGSSIRGNGSGSGPRNSSVASLRPAPVYLYREPVLPASMDLNSIDLQSLLRELRTFAERHAEQTAQVTEVAKDIQECLAHLYVQEPKVKTVYEPGPSGKEKEFYQFDIPYEESVRDKNVDHRLGEAWELWLSFSFGWMPARLPSEKGRRRERFLSSSSVDSLSTATALAGASDEEQHVCGLVATLFAAVRHICSAASDHEASQSVEAHRRGLAWFRELLAAEDPCTRAFPPAQRVLWATISKTGHVFVRTHEDDTLLILSSMLADAHRIHLLSPLFRPTNRLERLLDYYALAWKAIPSVPARDIILVLEHFDFAPWLALHPGYALRSKLLCMAASVLRERSWPSHARGPAAPVLTYPEDQAAEAAVFEFHVKLLLAVCRSSPEEHFVEVLGLLVGNGSYSYEADQAPDHGPPGSDPPSPGLGPAAAEGGLRVDVPQVTRDERGPALNGRIWDAVLNEIGTGIWSRVEPETLFAACDTLGGFYFELRMCGSGSAATVCTEPGSLVKQWHSLGLVDRSARLAHKIVLLMCVLVRESARDESIVPKELLVRSWASVATLFRPWMVSEYLDKAPQELLSPLNPDFAGRYLSDEISVPTLDTFGDATSGSASPGPGMIEGAGGERRYEAPWTKDTRDQAAVVLKSFVGCVSDLSAVSQPVQPYWVLDQVWWLYIDDLASSANNVVLGTITEELQRLPWDTWTLCDPILGEFVRLIDGHVAQDAVFAMVRHMVEEAKWSMDAEPHRRRFTATLAVRGQSMDMALRRNPMTNAAASEEFYAQVLRLTLTMLLKEVLPVPDSFGKFFFGAAHELPWSRVTPEAFRGVAMELELMLDALPKAEASRMQAQDQTQDRGSGGGLRVDTVEKKAVAALRMLGSATSLGQQRVGALDVAAEASLSDALQRERRVLGLLASLLRSTSLSHKGGGLAPVATPAAGPPLPSSTAVVPSRLQKLVSEGSALPFSTGALVMLVYESMQRILRLLTAPESPWAQACNHVAGVRAIADAGHCPERILDDMEGALMDVFSLLNIPGVVCARLGAGGAGLQGSDLGVASVVFGKVENVLRSISESLPPTLQFHEGESSLVASEVAGSRGDGGGEDDEMDDSEEGVDALGDSLVGFSAGGKAARNSGREAKTSSDKSKLGDSGRSLVGPRAKAQQWRHWRVMWRSVLPVMVAAARGEPPFDRMKSCMPEDPAAAAAAATETTSSGMRLALAMRRLARRRASSNSSQSSLAHGTSGFVTQGAASLEVAEVAAEGAFSVTGVGVGCLLYSFVMRFPACAPMYIVAALRSVTLDARRAEVVEAALEGWFSVRNDLGPIVAALCAQRDFGRVLDDETSILRLEACALRRGAWLTWFVLELYALATDVSSPADVLARLAHAVSQAVQAETAGPAGSYLRPSPLKLLPVITLLLDLVLRDHDDDDPSVNDAAFKVQQLHVCMLSLQRLVLDKEGIVSAFASAVLSRLPGLPFAGSSGPAGPGPGASLSSSPSATGLRHLPGLGASGSSAESSSASGAGGTPGSSVADDTLSGEDHLRMYVRALQVLVYLNTQRRLGALRVHAQDCGLNTDSRKAQQAMQALSQTYESSRVAQWALRFCVDPSHSIASYPTLVDELNASLFPHVKFLARPVGEWEALREAVRAGRRNPGGGFGAGGSYGEDADSDPGAGDDGKLADADRHHWIPRGQGASSDAYHQTGGTVSL